VYGYTNVLVAVTDVETNNECGQNHEAFIEREIWQPGDKWEIIQTQEGPETLIPETGTWVRVKYKTGNSDEGFTYQNSR